MTIAAAILCALAFGLAEIFTVMRRGPATGDCVLVSGCDGAGHERSVADSARFLLPDYINVANFMDGIIHLENGPGGWFGLCADRLDGGEPAVAGRLVWLLLVLCFCRWNVRPGKNACVFLGDAGSGVLGAALGAMAVRGLMFRSSSLPAETYSCGCW